MQNAECKDMVNRKNLYNSPSPGGRELEGGGPHPHLSPLPSRERKLIWNPVEDYTSKGIGIFEF